MTDRAYEKRFSERWIFWVLCGLAFIYMEYFIFVQIGRTGAAILRFVWIAVNVVLLSLLVVSRKTHEIPRRGRKWTDRIGGVWALFVLLSFLLLLMVDTAQDISGLRVKVANCLLLSFAVSAAVLIFGVKEANTVQITHLTLPTAKLPEGTERLRIVQLTDLHLGPWTGMSLLVQIVRKVRAAKPDIVVVTGDLADGDLNGRERELSLLRHMKSKYGTFAVTGNHDYYDNVDDAVKFMERAGMRVLRTEAAEAGGIIIAGADDRDHLEKGHWNLSPSEEMILSLEREQRHKFLLLLRHRPIVEDGTAGHFDLQLSGHTHGGQIVPLLSSRLHIAKHSRGFKKLKEGGLLYTSNGAGYVGPPVRLLAPPEILVLDLVRENNEKK